MKFIVNVSGGAASAIAWFRTVERHGAENVKAVFADTNSEHPDLYRFLDDCESHIGQKIHRIDKRTR